MTGTRWPPIHPPTDVSKKATGTNIGAVALSRAESLMRSRLPGYEPVCPKCMKVKKACEKHAKHVKL